MLKGLVQRGLRGSIEELTEYGLKNFTDIECELSNHGTLLVGVVDATRGPGELEETKTNGHGAGLLTLM